MPDRSQVVPLIERYFYAEGTDLKRGTIGMEHIIKDWGGPGPNAGTTCGYLPHWLWWRMGCTDKGLICRHEPDTSFKYKNGAQINRVYAHKAFVNLGVNHKSENDRKFQQGSIYPKTGDPIIIQGPPDKNGHETSHIFVVLDEGDWDSDVKGTWRVAETGQIDNGGHISHHSVELKSTKWMIGQRWMLGWLDLDNKLITFGGARQGAGDYLARFSKDVAGPMTKDTIGIWKVTHSRGQAWYYFFFKGFRVFYSDAATRTVLREGGYWIPQVGITIHWDSGTEEAMTLGKKGSATGHDKDGAWTATKVTSRPEILTSFNDGKSTAVF